MKTTLDIADNVLLRAKELARQQKVSLRALVEEGLELALARRVRQNEYSCRPVTFKGKGLSKDFRDAGWEAIRNAAYEGRGG